MAPLGEGVELAMPKALKRVVLASDAMSLLNWRDCPMLELAIVACPFLREAHFDSCDRLNDDVLRTLGDGSVPPALPAPYQHLPLRGCCPRLRCESFDPPHIVLSNCWGSCIVCTRSTPVNPP